MAMFGAVYAPTPYTYRMPTTKAPTTAPTTTTTGPLPPANQDALRAAKKPAPKPIAKKPVAAKPSTPAQTIAALSTGGGGGVAPSDNPAVTAGMGGSSGGGEDDAQVIMGPGSVRQGIGSRIYPDGSRKLPSRVY